MQQVTVGQECVDLLGYFGTGHARLQKGHTVFVGVDIGLPDGKACGIYAAREQRPLQRGVIARDHRKGIERQDVALFKYPRRYRIVRAVRVQSGLEPDPCVAVLGIGEPLGNLGFHRVAPCHRNVDFPRTHAHCVTDGIASHIGNIRTGADQGDFRLGLAHPLLHRRRRDIDARGRQEESIKLGRLQQGQVIALEPDHAVAAGH